MRGLKLPGIRELLLVICFVVFGVILGYLAIWFDRQYDQIFPLDIPGDFLYGFLGNHVTASVLVWFVLGAVLSLLFKPKVLAWIMGIYLVIFGGLWLFWESLHW